MLRMNNLLRTPHGPFHLYVYASVMNSVVRHIRQDGYTSCHIPSFATVSTSNAYRYREGRFYRATFPSRFSSVCPTSRKTGNTQNLWQLWNKNRGVQIRNDSHSNIRNSNTGNLDLQKQSARSNEYGKYGNTAKDNHSFDMNGR